MACVALVLGAAFIGSGTAAAAESGTVVIVHGLQGIDADLYLDGASSPALTSFAFRRVTDPLSLQPGVHRADVRTAGAPATTPPLLSGTFTVVAGQRVTVTALLDATGRPSWLAFPNDAWTFMDPDAQVRFRHLAAAGPVNLVVDGAPTIRGAANVAASAPSSPLELAAGVHDVAVVDAASGAVIVPPKRIDVAGGSIVNLYLTGRADPASLELVLQGAVDEPAPTVAVAGRVLPDTIDTGDSGLLSPASGSRRAYGLFAAAVAASVVFVAFVVASLTIRSHRRVPVRVRTAR